MQPKGGYSDDCGVSAGLSIDRCTELTNHEIRQIAQEYAEAAPGRSSCGAWIACVQSIRDIRLPGISEVVVRVYDDGSDDNPRHALLRATSSVTRPLFSVLRDELFKRFRLKLDP